MTTGEDDPTTVGFAMVARGMTSSMRAMRYAVGLVLAVTLANPAAAQVVSQPAATTAAPPPTLAPTGVQKIDTGAPAPAAAPAAPQAPVLKPMSEGVVATVNDEIISSYDLRQRLLLVIATSGVKVSQENLPELEQHALQTLVDERLQLQEFKHWGQKLDDADVEDDITAMAKENNMTKEQLLAGLHNAGVEPQTLRDQIRARTAWQMLVQGRYHDRAKIGADQVAKAMARIADASTKPQYLVGEIYIDANAVGGMDEATNGANQLVDQIVKGAPFQSVAKQFSNAPSAASGGDGGWLISGEIAPEVENALRQMRPGQLSKPIQTKDGVWIVYLREERAGGGITTVSLKQAAIRLDKTATPEQVEAATKKLASLQGKMNCTNIDTVAGKVDGVVASDLGESSVADLAPEFQAAATAMKPGDVSAPIRTDVGLHLVALCDKKTAGAQMPSKEEIENKLYAQQMTMLMRRYLRDLHNAATIEVK